MLRGPRALFRVLLFVAGLGVLDMHYTGSYDVLREMIPSTTVPQDLWAELDVPNSMRSVSPARVHSPLSALCRVLHVKRNANSLHRGAKVARLTSAPLACNILAPPEMP